MRNRNARIVCLLILILLHFGLGYYNYYLSIAGLNTDFYQYYSVLNESSVSFTSFFGSRFFIFINLIFSRFNFFGISLIYTFISFIPFYYLYNYFADIFLSIKTDLFLKFTIALLLFLPSVHFWLASFSKDSLCFFLIFYIIITFFKKWKNNAFRIFTIVVSVILLFLLRPYLFLILLFGYTFLNRQLLTKKYLICLGLITVILTTISLKYFLRVDHWDFEYFRSVAKSLVEYSKTGNSVINLENSTMFSRFFIMMFRPLMYDAKDLNQYAVSFENLILLCWFLYAVFLAFKHKKLHSFKVPKISLWFGVTGLLLWLFYSIYIYNLGLASRMKATILPFLFIYFVSLFKNTNRNNITDGL